MRRFVFVFVGVLGAFGLGLAGPVVGQDAVQAVLQAAPQLVSFAGSPANLESLVVGLTQGRPVRLVAPDVARPKSEVAGFNRVTTLTPGIALPPAQVAAVLERARQDLASFGIAQPTPAQITIALVGGTLEVPTGSTQLRGALPQRGSRPQVAMQLEPDERRASPEEQAFARLPADLQSMLGGLPPAEALQKVQLAQQQLIALGIPSPSPGQRRTVLRYVLNPGYGSVESASAGATTFPPLSPLVAAQPPSLAGQQP
jgi:hypothetical protein